jgi:hypothetical protein
LPAPIQPAPELLGEVLAEAGRPVEAIASFESVLQRYANRSRTVLGLARAAAAAGQKEASHRRYTELLANFDGADTDLPALREARAALATTPNSAGPTSSGLTPIAVSIATGIVVVAGAAALLRRKKRSPVSRAPQKKSSKRRR